MARAVPAVERAFDVLELFLDSDELSAPEITAQLGLPRTTVHELVGTLNERGYLMPTGRGTNKFRLGVRSFQLGAAYAERLDLAREGQLVAEDIAERCQETVHVGVRDGAEVLYVVKVDSSHPVRMVSAVGHRLPAHCTALGKVMLAALPRAEFDELYGNRKLEPMTEHSITNRKTLRSELDTIATDGIAGDYCEATDSVSCIAAPVRDQTGQVVAAMSISVPILRWNDETEAALRDLVSDGAKVLSRHLGHVTD